MGLFDKLLGRSEQQVSSTATAEVTCPHLALTPRWDSVDDIGHEERATGYHCESCGRDFSAADARRLRSSEGDRLRESVPPEARN